MPTAQSVPGSPQDCAKPICSSSNQTNCTPPGRDLYASCYANMLSRCLDGSRGKSGNWCVRAGGDANACPAHAAEVCRRVAGIDPSTGIVEPKR
ncbi:MAG TPA: hypothetical protein VM491_16435 [Burkholderiaceae bacterium]|nr:hypothetical protein [Burkholderiaceae bacterium]